MKIFASIPSKLGRWSGAMLFAGSLALAAAVPIHQSNAQIGLSGVLNLETDLCANVAGVQLNINECEDDGPAGGGNGVNVEGADVCANVAGIQLNVNECGADAGGGAGVGVDGDLCANVAGIQLNINECGPGGGEGPGGVGTTGPDVCANIEGIQLNINECGPGGGGGPTGGVGVTGPDVCANIAGVQLTIGECGPGGAGGPTGPIGGGPGGPTGPIGGGPGGGGGGGAGGAAVDRTTLGAINGAAGAVCLFDAPNFQGTQYCVARGVTIPDLGAFSDRVRSIMIQPGAVATVCSGNGLSGTCTTVETNLAQLLGGWDMQISSIAVQ